MVGTTPLREPLWVRPGRHTITVMHAGYVARTRVIELDANAGAIEIALTSSPPPEAAIDASPGDQPTRRIDPVNPYGGNAPIARTGYARNGQRPAVWPDQPS
jgi:hypothetical protein